LIYKNSYHIFDKYILFHYS